MQISSAQHRIAELSGGATADDAMETEARICAPRTDSPEIAQASKVRVVGQEVANPAVGVAPLESWVLARVSSMLEVRHKEVCQQVAVAVRSEAEDSNKHIAKRLPGAAAAPRAHDSDM